MKRCRLSFSRATGVAVLAFAGMRTAIADNYAFFDPDESASHLWSHVAGWYGCGDYVNDQTRYRSNIKPLGALPDESKSLMVDSDKLTPNDPLVIDGGRQVVVSRMQMASYIGSPYGDAPHWVALEVGEGALLTTKDVNAQFNVGSCAGGQGLLYVDAGAVVSNASFRIGSSGFGVVTNRGGQVVAHNDNSKYGLFLGYESTATGVYVQTSGELRLSRCRVGRSGAGRLEILGGGMNGTTFLGEQAGGRGTTVFSGVTVTNAATVGCAADSWGCLHLRGATNHAGSVTIRNHADAYGQLRGWGAIYAYSTSDVCGELNNFFMNGQAVADGEGVDGRLLDLSLIRTGDGSKYSNVKVTIPNGVSGTNGWYAVNRGVLAYPMISVRGATWTGTVFSSAGWERFKSKWEIRILRDGLRDKKSPFERVA